MSTLTEGPYSVCYKGSWLYLFNFNLLITQKEAKDHEKHAIGIYLEADNELVGQVPMVLSCLDTFLKAYDDDNEVFFKVTGSRMLDRLLRMDSLS